MIDSSIARMPTPAQWEQLFRVFSVICVGVLAFRIFALRLNYRYPRFAIFLIVDFLQEALLLRIPMNTNLYAIAYFGSEPIIWLFYYLIVLELYALILNDYPSIDFLGHVITKFLLPAFLVVVLWVTLPSLRGFLDRSSVLPPFHFVPRA